MMKEILPKEAYEMLKNEKDAILIDVRSSMEYEFVGHPINSVHIPLKQPPKWETESGFVENVKLALNNLPDKIYSSDTVMLMLCRSGARSALAAEMLINEGYTNVYNVLEGFEGDKDKNGHRNTINGWRFHKLPWEQS